MSKKQVGTMPSGAAVYEIGLANGKGMSVNILTYGAIIKDIFVPDKDGNIGNVVLGQDTFEDVREKAFCYAMLVGRVANRIKGASFEIDGNVYHLQANEFANTLHSGDANYAKRNFEIAEEDGKSVTLTLDDPEETAGGFPGNAKLSVTYTVTDDCTLLIAYDFICDKDTPVNLTNHAYFNLSGEDTVENHEVCMDAPFYTPADEENVPTGEIAKVEGTGLDMTKKIRVGEVLEKTGGVDHNFVLPGRGYRKIAELTHEGTGRKMEVFTDQPGVQVFTSNFFSEELTKRGGVPLKKFGAICFETQTFPDAVNESHFPEGILEKNTKKSSVTGYRFGII